MKGNEGIIYDGVKAFSLRELSDRGWTIQGSNDTDTGQLYKDAAWLYAVIQKRAGGVMSIIDEVRGLERFERQVGPVKYNYAYDPKNNTSPDGLVWVWQSGMSEIGPGTPRAEVAAGPAALLRAIDMLGIQYFSRGAIGQVYFTTPTPMQPEQKSAFKTWWDKLWGGGLDTAYNTAAVFGDGFTPHKLSADPKDLEMTALDTDNRRDISAIYDTPEALVTGDAGSLSRATLDRITSNWINGTIMQQASLIVDAFNHHILEPAGYMLELNAEGMTVNQEEERQRAQAVSFYVSAGFNPEWVAHMFNLEGPEDIPMMAEKQPIPEQLRPPGLVAEDDESAMDVGEDEAVDEKAVEYAKLRRYIANGKHLKRPFESDVLTPMEIAWEAGKAQDTPFRKSSKDPSNWETRRLTLNSKNTTR